jgi:hypothetical protein
LGDIEMETLASSGRNLAHKSLPDELMRKVESRLRVMHRR